MRTDIKDLEVSRTLRRLGNLRVTEWEFSDILPKVKEIAATEVDVVDLVKRTANLRVNQWELSDTLPKVKEFAATEVDVLNFFKRTANLRVNDWQIGGLSGDSTDGAEKLPAPSPKEAQACTRQLTSFLSFVAHNLIENTDQMTIKVSSPSPSEIRFRLILTQRDAAALIGHGGHTATAIRNLMKDAGSRSRFFVDLKILSQDEEKQRKRIEPYRNQWKDMDQPPNPVLTSSTPAPQPRTSSFSPSGDA